VSSERAALIDPGITDVIAPRFGGVLRYILRRSGRIPTMFRRFAVLAALAVLLATALAPLDADARAGLSSSMGSRGSRTYSMPGGTNTAPGGGMLMDRSLTPQSSPSTSGMPSYGYGFGGRSPFMSGMMGGLLGAGLGGLLFGRGFFHGITGFGGFFGFMLQMLLVVWIGRMIWRWFAGRQLAAVGAGMYARGINTTGAMAGGGGGGAPLQIAAPDYHAFEDLLHGIQAAWSSHDLNAMRQMASPEMVSYFAEQMAEQTSRGVWNAVTDVHLEKGDLSEAWAEPGRDYATVAMRFSMVDVTRDGAGRVVEGDPAHRVQATELWTFLRAPGGNWVLAAIQQAR
jgi:predicted lipid-binding transport protein (Tim44 family)